MTTTYFRALLLLSVLCAIPAIAIDMVFPELLPTAVAQAIENEPLPPTFSNLLAVIALLVLVLAFIPSTIGLYFFKPWARVLAFYFTLLSLAVNPFLGPTLTSGYANAFITASAYMWGATLALAYFSPIREKFIQREPLSSRGDR